MRRNSITLKIVTLSAVFALGISGVVIHQNKKAHEVEAAQHMDNYASYTYSGNYYNSITFNDESSYGMNGTLRQSLTSLILPSYWYTYSGTGADTLSEILQKADQDPTNSNNMVYLYTRDSVTKNAATGWNREHVWPQSLSSDVKDTKNWGTSYAGADLLHIRPTYESTNSSRSNDKYCDVNKSEPRTMSSNGMLFGYGSGEKFEPLDAVKGDVARIIMYIWTAYTGFSHYSYPFSITKVFESYDTLLKWHAQDKPDVLEGNRNDYCESSKQGNRNPFVDHPELAWQIFGSEASSSALNICKNAYPVNGGGGGNSGNTGEESTLSFSVADYYTTNSLSNGTKVTHIAPNNIVSIDAVANSSNGNTGKMYKGDSYTEWRFYSADSGALKISVADGYELKSAKGQIGSSNYGSPSEINFTISNNMVQYNTGSNFNVKSLEITYAPIVETVELTGIELNESELNLTVGEEETLVVSPLPSDAELGTVTWTSSQSTVASVNGGVVTALKGGTTTITASCGGFTATCLVTVANSDTSTVILDYTAMTTGGISTTAGEQTFNKNGLTFVISNGVANTTNSDIRVYKGATITFSATNITRIEFTCSSSNPASNFTSFDGFNNSTGVWMGSSASISFTASAAQVRITKIAITYTTSGPIQEEDSPDDFLQNTATYASIYGKELGTIVSSITFENQGYSNAETLDGVSIAFDSAVSIECSKGTGSNSPAYYDAGSSLRIYGGNTFTISSNNANVRIIKIDFTIGSGTTYDMSKLTASTQSLSGNVWSGEANTITFTNGESSGHVRIYSIKVTYYEDAQSYSVTSVGMRFGASIAKTYWDAINNNENWEIVDYGVMMVKQSTLQNTYKKDSVEAAYRAGLNLSVSNKLKDGEYANPYLVGGVYSFTARLSSIPSDNYNTKVCAAPYIVVKDNQNHEEYYFLAEICKSAKELAEYYITTGGSNLSNKALGIIGA